MKLKRIILVAALVCAAILTTDREEGLASVSATTCSQTGKRPDNSACQVGDTGPGGGIVYYDAGSMQSWGRYMEVAPNTWYGGTSDPYIVWCNPRKSSGSDGRNVGDGKSNFEQLEGCAIHTAVSSYRGGEQSDWIVPSSGDLYQLKLWQQAVSPWQGGFVDSPHAYYWTSSRYNTGAVFWYLTSDTRTNVLVWPQTEAVLTRPIRYIGLNPSQTVTWSPTTSLVTTQSPFTPSAATSNGDGGITYSKVSNTTTTCAVDSLTGALTFTGTGDCVVRATAAQSSDWSAGSKTVTFTVGLPTQVVTWLPRSNIDVMESPYLPRIATSDGGGAITYSKVSNTTTSCQVDTETGEMTFSGLGTCEVRATAAATSEYLTGSTDVTFTIGRATQQVSWNPGTSLLRTSSPVTLSPATSNSGGDVFYEVTNSGTTGCTVGSTSGILAFISNGECTVRASVDETSLYESASKSVTFVIYENAIELTTAIQDTPRKSQSSQTTRATTTSTTSTTSTTTTTIAPPVVSQVSPGEVVIEVDGKREEVVLSRENNALVLQAGGFSAKLWATNTVGDVIPLDTEGNIRVADEANISFVASGFLGDSESEVWVYSTPTLLGMTQADAVGNLEGSFALPVGIENGSHRIVLAGTNRSNEDISVVVGMIVGDGSEQSAVASILLGVVISLAVLSALFLPAIIRRRRRTA
jgi:hypothetical protein